MKALQKITLLFSSIFLFTLHTNAFSLTSKATKLFYITTNSVSITIDAKTTTANLEDIKVMLREHQIDAVFSNIRRNAEGLITGIKISLTDLETNQKTTSSFSSTLPIETIEFGKKEDALYIVHGNSSSALSFLKNNRKFSNRVSHDSIMQNSLKLLDSLKNNVFNMEEGTFTFNGKTLNLEEIQKSLENVFTEDENGVTTFQFQNFPITDLMDLFSDFIPDDLRSNLFNEERDSKKIIIIDGSTSNFKTLNELATKNALESIDVLQPATATSIYGSKGKHGAIIVTTKK